MAEAPTPVFLFRLHLAAITDLHFQGDTLISADSDGYIALWDLDVFRPFFLFKGHTAGVLKVVTWAGKLLSHGRDNVIHIYELPQKVASTHPTAPQPASHDNVNTLEPLYSLQVNSLAFCKFSLCPLSDQEAYVAVPSVLHDDKVDVFHLPTCNRIWRSIGHDVWPINDKTGTIMALTIVQPTADTLRLVTCYEDGRLAVLDSVYSQKEASQIRPAEGQDWRLVWYDKGHKEPIMGLALTPNLQVAWTVAADHLVIRWLLPREESTEGKAETVPTLQPGRSSIAVRSDDRLLVTGGWDGQIRVHSAKTFKPLAVLTYHRDSVQTVAVAEKDKSRPERKAWIAAGGKDQRISLWDVYN